MSTPSKNYSGTWTTNYPSGRVAEETEYRRGKWHGSRITRYDNSENSLKAEEYWNSNKRSGDWKTWFETPPNQLRSTASWKNGLPNGTTTHWHANGKKKSECQYSNGIHVGDHQHWNDAGLIIKIEHWQSGNITSVEHFQNEEVTQVDIYKHNEVVKVQHLKDGVVCQEEDPRQRDELACQLTIVGVYPVVPTAESIAQAAQYHKYEHLLDANGSFQEPIVWANNNDLCLVEVQIDGDFSPRALIRSIGANDQAPYLEFYIDAAGTTLISESVAVSTPKRRVCFFLHFLADNVVIKSGNDSLNTPARGPVPERLASFVHYVPVD
ncbi:toxin-antitoxin system YwqK family antitoxin [Bremerella sp. P1]|uniref:toxin-antitoxin system YwqK family antitoxin n=1 Tax=Bremerella sp. P1 TaxID=3026424 RepID=UPI0023687FA2|nr:hypothetical protein [Bremerella sp. P1]WDI42178.1 hypothetical protein PSR63_27385 [Bremerella sp. P1]